MPVLPVPMPMAATLGPIAPAGRSTVKASAAHCAPGLRSGKTSRTRGFEAMASRMNRPRSAAMAPVAQTIFTRSAGLLPSSQRMRPHTCTLLPWSRGNSTSARGWSVRNLWSRSCTAAGRTGFPDRSVRHARMNRHGSARARGRISSRIQPLGYSGAEAVGNRSDEPVTGESPRRPRGPERQSGAVGAPERRGGFPRVRGQEFQGGTGVHSLGRARRAERERRTQSDLRVGRCI